MIGGPSKGGPLPLLMTYILRPPTVYEAPMGDGPLFSRYKIRRGMSILKNLDGSYSTVRFPAQTDIEASAGVYMGGHEYPLSGQEVTDLTAAGYGAYITNE